MSTLFQSFAAGAPSIVIRTPSILFTEVYVAAAATVDTSCCTASAGVPARGAVPTSARSTVITFPSIVTPRTATGSGHSVT